MAGVLSCQKLWNLFVQVAIYRCLLDIAAGMDYLHSLGVLHGECPCTFPVGSTCFRQKLTCPGNPEQQRNKEGC